VLLLSNPTIAEIPIYDCGEELIDLTKVPELALDLRKPEQTGARLRSGVVARLRRAQDRLPASVKLLIIEGHRPTALQRGLFETHRAGLAAAHPDWPDARLHSEASKHVAPPSVAPHPCGAAVDLTLSQDGREVYMGTQINATPEQSGNACFTDAPNITENARTWREVLSVALCAEGLINYPAEWWHWSFGDRCWAAVVGNAHALYGPL
jgi:zinc D-Ala-D-Ala dipeptidase